MILNPNLLILQNEENFVLLKVGSSNNLVKMSPVEFKIISLYSEMSSFEFIKEHLKKEVDIDREQMDLLLLKASENKILLAADDGLDQCSAISFVFNKNGRIFEIFDINFTNTILEKFFENRFGTNFIVVVLIFCYSYIIVNIISEPLHIKEDYLSTLYKVPVPFSVILVYIYLGSFLSTLIHEFGHYFVYKRYYGKTSVFGFGLLFYLIPIVFNRVFIGVIKKKRCRIWINAGGMLFDLLQFVFLIYFTKIYHEEFPIMSFFGYMLMVSITIRTFFNLNIFLPGTDGYYIFSDFLNKPNLFEIAQRKTRNLLSKEEKSSYKNYLYALYVVICYCFITISWSTIMLPIITYIYYANFK